MTGRAANPEEHKNIHFALGLLGFFALDLIFCLAGQLGALVLHARWPRLEMSQALGVAIGVARHPGAPALAWPVSERVLVPGAALFYFVLFLLLAGAVLGAVFVWRLAGRGGRPGFARRREVRAHLSRRGISRRAGQVRPGIEKPAQVRPEELGVRLGRATDGGTELWASLEDSFLILGPPRSNKTAGIVIPRVIDAPGAVVATSIRPEVLRHTATARGGPTYVFDPQGSSRWRRPLRWSPVAGCEDPGVAMRRARGFAEGAGGAQLKSAGDEFFRNSAAAVIRCYLHAAALEGLTITDVLSWVARPEAEEPLEILAQHPGAAPAWDHTLFGASHRTPETRDGIWATVERAFDSFADPRVLAACSPGPEEAFSPPAFLSSGGTLHVLGSPQTQMSVAPLISAFVEDVVEVAREVAGSTPTGRLDPPLSLWLDEVANIAPLDWLPQLLSSSGGSGICTTVVLQSLAQARTRWGADQADAIWDASTVRIVFGGLGGAEDLTRISRLAGEVDEEVRSHTRGSTGSSWSSSPQRRPALPIDYLRTLPEGKAVVLHRRTPPVEAVFDGWWKLPVAEQVRASLKTWETDAAVAP
jgi:type IV secretion system protein VirD4